MSENTMFGNVDFVNLTLADESTYELRYPIKSIIAYESFTGEGLMRLAHKVQASDVRYTDFRNVIWAGLIHLGKNFTIKKVESMLDGLSLEYLVGLIDPIMSVAFKVVDPDEGGDSETGNPQ